MSLFSTVNRPAFKTVYGNIPWYTWSDTFRSFFADCKKRDDFKSLQPQLIFIPGFNEYNYSYHIDFKPDLTINKHKKLVQFASDLFRTTLSNDIHFFTGLIDKDITSDDFHKIFAVFRSVIAFSCKNEMEALYAPLTTSNKGHFPLHCDLYIPKLLFNVYEAVPKDDSGASIFLKMDTLLQEVLPAVDKMPATVKDQINAIIAHKDYIDRYEVFYELLNGIENPWYRQLTSRIARHRFAIKFNKGQGYMLNDRKWLHGRLRPTGALTEKRVHRLVFNSFTDTASFDIKSL